MNKGNAEDGTSATHRSVWRVRRIVERTRDCLGRPGAEAPDGGNGTRFYGEK